MSHDWHSPLIQTVDLGPEQLLLLHGREPAQLRVLFGSVWLTRSGCLDDVFTAAGHRLDVPRGDGALIQAIGPVRMEVARTPRLGVGAQTAQAARAALYVGARWIAQRAQHAADRLAPCAS